MSGGSADGILAASWALGQITFGAPAMLWGALAAAGPIVIHLVLRARAQRVPLPTVRFAIRMQQQTQARQRLKNLLLLLLRMLAILLLVASLARPTLETAAFSTVAREPVEAVFCMDDSASMGYRSRNRTRYEVARELAVRLLRDRIRFPTGSRLALLTGSLPSAATRLSLDIDYVRKKVEQLDLGEHDRGVAAMLHRAYALLEDGVLEKREIYLFGDLTQRAWRDVPVGAYTSRRDVRVFCVDVGVDRDTNFALLDPVLPDRVLPAGSAAEIRFGVRAGDAGGRRDLEVVLDGKPRWRLGPIALRQRAVKQQTVELTNLSPGLHQGEIRLGPEDPLGVDNVRYFTLDVGALPKVVVVGPRDGEVAALVSAMIAPASLAAGRQRVELTRHGVAELVGVGDLTDYLAIILADVGRVPGPLFARLGKYVANGGCLIVVPGPALDPAGYRSGAGALAAMPAEIAVPLRPVHVAPLDRPHPWLRPFQDGSGLSLSEPAIRRYVRFDEPLDGGEVIARLDDGAAAVVARRIGRGSSAALAFSPVRDWSDFAVDAGPMLVLLNSIITESMTGTSRAGNLSVGQVVRLAIPPAGARAPPDHRAGSAPRHAVTITSPGRRQSWPVTMDPDARAVQAVTDRCGHYLVTLDDREGQARLGYSVNTPANESDLSRISMKAIRSRFPPHLVTRVERLDELEGAGGARPTAHALAGWLALVLLGVLMAESLLSNRFHRQPEADRPVSG